MKKIIPILLTRCIFCLPFADADDPEFYDDVSEVSSVQEVGEGYIANKKELNLMVENHKLKEQIIRLNKQINAMRKRLHLLMEQGD